MSESSSLTDGPIFDLLVELFSWDVYVYEPIVEIQIHSESIQHISGGCGDDTCKYADTTVSSVTVVLSDGNKIPIFGFIGDESAKSLIYNAMSFNATGNASGLVYLNCDKCGAVVTRDYNGDQERFRDVADEWLGRFRGDWWKRVKIHKDGSGLVGDDVCESWKAYWEKYVDEDIDGVQDHRCSDSSGRGAWGRIVRKLLDN